MARHDYRGIHVAGIKVRIHATSEVREIDAYCCQSDPHMLPRSSVFIGGYGWLATEDMLLGPAQVTVVEGTLPDHPDVIAARYHELAEQIKTKSATHIGW